MSVNYSSPMETPSLVKTVAILTLVNGIVNIFWGLVAAAGVLSTVVLACLVGFAILPTVLGVFEVVYAAKLLAEPIQPIRPSRSIAVLEILCLLAGNVFSMVVGILSLVFYNDPQVVGFFARLNGEVPQPPRPASLPEPSAAPKVPEPAPAASPAKQAAPKAKPAPKAKKPPQKAAAKGKAGSSPQSSKPKPKPKSGSSSS
jgi:hypothetical protein